jgi:hypothetical protein
MNRNCNERKSKFREQRKNNYGKMKIMAELEHIDMHYNMKEF